MGQVFTWEAVNENRIPERRSFKVVIEHLQHSVAQAPYVLGLVLCGSGVYGEHTIRSDLDCFLLYDVAKESSAFSYMQHMTAWADRLHVPLAFIPCDSEIAREGMHHVGGSFRKHIEKAVCSGGLLKGNPLEKLAPGLSMKAEIDSYLRVKMYNLQEAWSHCRVFSEERMASYLKKLLEAPVHVARKVLAYSEDLPNDTKAFIRKRYSEVMPEVLASELDSLIALDSRYTQWLLERSSEPDEMEYRKLLLDIEQASPRAISFIRENLLHLKTA